MAILGALLMVAGGAIVLASAILWLWSTSRQKLLDGQKRARISRRKSQVRSASGAKVKAIGQNAR